MIITFGEILLRLSTPEAGKISQVNGFNAAYGGAEANVAVSLSLLGNEVAHVTRFPENNLSHAAIMSLKKFGINTGKIIWGGSRLGLYYLETGQGLRGSKVIYDRAGSAMAEIKPGMVNWKKAFEGVTWFHFSGITPAISQSAADTCLEALQVAEEQGITVSIDLNFREKLWKYGKRPNEILPELLDYCDIIFGGIDAPEKIFGIVPEGKQSTKGKLTTEDIHSISGQLFSLFPKAALFSTTLRYIQHSDHHKLQGVIITPQQGSSNSNVYYAHEYDMPNMVDRVGGGDAFMAGLIHGIIHFKDDYHKIVNFATAASVLKHYIHGDANLSTLEEIENMMKGHGQAISR